MPIKLFDDFLRGKVLWSNPEYQSPTRLRITRISQLMQRQVTKERAKGVVEMEREHQRLQDQDNLFHKQDPGTQDAPEDDVVQKDAGVDEDSEDAEQLGQKMDEE